MRRGLVLACGAVLLNQPEWVEEFRPQERPTVTVLVDASPSMGTRDVVAPGAASLFPVALPVPTSTPVVSSYADTVYVIPLQLGATVPIANVSVPVV